MPGETELEMAPRGAYKFGLPGQNTQGEDPWKTHDLAPTRLVPALYNDIRARIGDSDRWPHFSSLTCMPGETELEMAPRGAYLAFRAKISREKTPGKHLI